MTERAVGPLHLGVIGCGGMGGSHLRGLNAIGERLVVAATADLLMERAQQAAHDGWAGELASAARDLAVVRGGI